MPSHATPHSAPKRQLTLLDSTCIIVGIVVGAGIYESTPFIARCAGSAPRLAVVWVVGGLMALVGAMCYAELTTTYPREGGDYVFLSRAFGRQLGFVFSWMQLWVVRPGSIGAMAFVFARYANQLWPLGRDALVIYAAASIGALSLLNVVGVRESKWTQNLLTLAKVAGLAAVIVIALASPAGAGARPEAASAGDSSDFRLAMILVMFTYGGWNDMSFVAAEVRAPEKNLVRALLLGTASVVAIYLLVNFAFVHLLGFEGMAKSKAVAADVVQARWGARAISLLVCVSCLGALNGMIFTGARIYYATGAEHPLFSYLGSWNARFGTPVRSLIWQGAIALAATIGIGLGHGESGFQRLVVFTAPVFWFFLLLTSIALVKLRRTDAQAPRPYRVHGYPVTPLVFYLASLFMLYSSVSFAAQNVSPEAVGTLAILGLGIALAFVERRQGSDAL